jgi:hypothetical protein
MASNATVGDVVFLTLLLGALLCSLLITADRDADKRHAELKALLTQPITEEPK